MYIEYIVLRGDCLWVLSLKSTYKLMFFEEEKLCLLFL